MLTEVKQITQNVMEVLVNQEIDLQMAKQPQKIAKSLNRTEIATYALNRLPPLYASSAEGFEYQKRKARQALQAEISKAVRQGFAAVQKDPLRTSTPLMYKNYTSEQEELKIKAALGELNNLIPRRDALFLIQFVKNLVTKIAQGEMTKEEMSKLHLQLYFDWKDLPHD